jgi:hypothetical protein
MHGISRDISIKKECKNILNLTRKLISQKIKAIGHKKWVHQKSGTSMVIIVRKESPDFFFSNANKGYKSISKSKIEKTQNCKTCQNILIF